MWSLLFIVFAIVGGIIQIIVAIISKSNKQKMLGNSPTAIGTVTDYNSHLGFRNTTTYYPIIAFQDASGQNFQVDSAEGAIWKAYKIGETLEIFYDPRNPTNAEIKNNRLPYFWLNILSGLFFVFLGTVFLGAYLFFGI